MEKRSQSTEGEGKRKTKKKCDLHRTARKLSVGNEIYKWANWTRAGITPKCNFHPAVAHSLLQRSGYSCCRADQFSPSSPPSPSSSSLCFFLHHITILSICLPDWLHSRRQIIWYYDKIIQAWCCEMHVALAYGNVYKERRSDLWVHRRQLSDDESHSHIAKVRRSLKWEHVYFSNRDHYFLRRHDPCRAFLVLDGITKFTKHT